MTERGGNIRSCYNINRATRAESREYVKREAVERERSDSWRVGVARRGAKTYLEAIVWIKGEARDQGERCPSMGGDRIETGYQIPMEAKRRAKLGPLSGALDEEICRHVVIRNKEEKAIDH